MARSFHNYLKQSYFKVLDLKFSQNTSYILNRKNDLFI